MRASKLIMSVAALLAAVYGMKGAATVHKPAAAPSRLSDTGLYDESGAIDSRNLPFVPQYALWSDGAKKLRWIRLPEGAKIDVSDVDAWRFPAGTKFWKEFSWGGRKVETRMIWKAGEDNWVFATYQWNAEQTEAMLAPESGVPNVVEVARGKRHSIPSVEDCRTCHEASPATVLGFNALQLSDDRDPLAPHAEPLSPNALTIRKLVEADRLYPRRPDLVSHPPRIRESNPIARAALGYLSANCGGCHNDRGPLAHLGLVLLHDEGDDAEPAEVTAVGAAGRYVMPGVDAESSRLVAPGAPARSALLHRMRSRRPSSQMPPLGTTIVDDEASALVQRWIESLGYLPGTTQRLRFPQ